MGIAVAIALGALAAAIAPLFAMYITFRQHAEDRDDRDQRERLRDIEAQLSRCRGENLELMRKLLRLNGGE